jgi:hypothetical protein
MMIDLGTLRKLLNDQYLLHEVQHHSVHSIQEDDQVPREPVAHSLVDIYKCLHQGEFGIGHLIDDLVNFQNRLFHDILKSHPTSDEPILENVSINGIVMRLNLRPFRALYGNDIEKACNVLAKVCINSSENTKGDNERFFSLLHGFRDLNREGKLRVGKTRIIFPTDMVDHFLREVKKIVHRIGEIPVFSHSAKYRQLNEPSYRVIDMAVVQNSELSFLFEQGNPNAA